MAVCRTCIVAKLPKHILKQLPRLTLGDCGSMRRSFQELHKSEQVYYIVEEGKVITWSLKDARWIDNFYTRKTHRHKGYATRLIKYIKRKRGQEELTLWRNFSKPIKSDRQVYLDRTNVWVG